MLEIIAPLVYLSVLTFIVYHVIKAFKTSHHELREEIAELRKDISSRLVVTYKVVAGFIRTPLLMLALLMLSACMMLSALSTHYTLAVSSRCVGETGMHAIYVGFKEPVPVSEVDEYLKGFEHADVYVRYVLNRRLVLSLDGEELRIYALVGLPPCKSGRLLGLKIDDSTLVVGGDEPRSYVLTHIDVNYTLITVNPKTLEEVTIFYRIPLLPVEAYLGTKPVTVPSDKVLITTPSTASKLIGLSETVTTDLVIELTADGLEAADLKLLNELASRYGAVVMILRNDVLETLSGYGLPTTESLTSALISALISSIILSATFSALQPRVRQAYSKLSSIGLQPWNFTTILTIFVAALITSVGVSMIVMIDRLFGTHSALNSFITFIASATTSVVFASKKVFNVGAVEAVPVPTSTKFNLIIRGSNACEVLGRVSELLREEDFFELKDLDMRCERSEGFLHASCRFKGSWGIGVDLDVFVGKYGDDGVELSFNISAWSVEELSEKQLESVLRLFQSKILGGVEVWASVQGAW